MRLGKKSLLFMAFAGFVLGCNAQKPENSDEGKKAESDIVKQDKDDVKGDDLKKPDTGDAAKAGSDDVKAGSDDVKGGENSEGGSGELRKPEAGAGAVAGTVCEEAEGCACGETTCPMNAVCTDGVCKCGDTLVESYYTGYICMEIAKGVYDLGCTESDGCPCGKVKVYANMGCSGKWGTCAGIPVSGRGLSCRHKPHNGMMYSLGCFKDECTCFGTTIHKDDICDPPTCSNGFELTPQGCSCNGLIDNGTNSYKCVTGKEDKKISVCLKSDGCDCGEEQFCPIGSVCYHKKCVDRATLKALPEEGYKIERGLPQCDSDECVCHKTKCKSGAFCLNGVCYGDPYFRKIDGKVYYYHLFTKDPVADAGAKEKYRDVVWELLFMDESAAICSKFGSVRVKGGAEDICKDSEHAGMTVAEAMKHCGTAPIPEKVATMYCTLDVEDGALLFSGWEND